MGPWYSKPWWVKWPELAFWRFFAHWGFAVDLVRWLLLGGYRDRAWYGTDERISWADSERIHLEILWAAAIGKADIACGRYGEIVHE